VSCELCTGVGGERIWQHGDWRVIRIADHNFPAFYRVVHEHHVAEFTDLEAGQRERCMGLVTAVEQVLRDTLAPTKINLASLGNQTPHLHWHVIARFDWDSHYPQPVWGAAQRTVNPPATERLNLSLDQLDARVAAALQAVN
jgi:diadenosine tetraphosphate (Ap4A) HIT family hydrolase